MSRRATRAPGAVQGRGRGGGASAFVGAVPNDLAKKSRSVSLRSVICPDCKADLGEPCQSSVGTVLPNGHRSRRRMATRLDNETRSAQ